MKIDLQRFSIPVGAAVDLRKWPTAVGAFYSSKADYHQRLADNVESLAELQDRFYAANRYALLLIFQAMDSAGKDGVIKHVMSGVNPQGCQVFSFKHPSLEELEHDFLWRTTRDLPARGRIGIFNRSYYEEVLIVRVHPEILAAQNLAPEFREPQKIWDDRYRSIVDMESHLSRNGTKILKFFLHLSKDEQRRRFRARIDDPRKNWKFSPADMAERGFWKEYQAAYAACLQATSSATSPWFIVPADDKKNARLIVSEAILATLRDLKLQYPQPPPGARKELARARKQL